MQIALQGAIFSLKAQIAYKLQDIAYQTPELIAFRKTLVDDMVRKVQELNKENFAVRQHLKYVELYSNPDHYTTFTYENTLQMREELAPLITPDADDAKAVRFDALMYGIELAYLRVPDCNFFCNGKLLPQRTNLCGSIPCQCLALFLFFFGFWPADAVIKLLALSLQSLDLVFRIGNDGR